MKKLITTAVMAVLACVSMSAIGAGVNQTHEFDPKEGMLSIVMGSMFDNTLMSATSDRGASNLFAIRLSAPELVVSGDAEVGVSDARGVSSFDFGGGHLEIRQIVSISRDQALVNAKVLEDGSSTQTQGAPFFNEDGTMVNIHGDQWRVRTVSSAIYDGTRVASFIVDRVTDDNLAKVTVTVKNATTALIEDTHHLHKGGLERRDVRAVLRNIMDQESEIVSVEVTDVPETNSIRLVAQQDEELAETRIAVTGGDYEDYMVISQ